jgi:hypothetical protein
MEEKAKNLFLGKEKYNCAQAILAAFQEKYDIPQEHIDGFKALGGGKAQEGLCGALYAGLSLARQEEAKARLTEEFTRLAGATKCREIRKGGKLSCKECVALAAATLERHDDAN